MKPVKIEKAFFVKEKTLFPILPIGGRLPKKFRFLSRDKSKSLKLRVGKVKKK